MNSSRVLSLASQSLLVLCATILASPQLRAQSTLLAKQIREIADRPEYRHSSFGIEVYSLDDNKVVFSRDADKLFTPASTTKLLTMGSAMELLGKDFRFHTFIYRTGPIDSDGTLKGDLVLVASGDPDLSGRIRPDGTLAFENEDHSYDGSPDTKAVPGDPLLVIRELASQVVSHGVKKIDGRVLVDISLFPQGTRELGTGVVISPICVNDNIVDVTAVPGKNAGDDVILNVSPRTSYVTFVNQAKTAAADSKPSITWQSDIINPDGSHKVTVTGTMPAGKPSILYAYAIPEPD
ncbi:MAG TPA: D-alanyl-D-alanine carboxypeptidase, partial [Terriglobia bacterium]|nr:D-alanyl-D-alanine carboxypeptidase [Terriglobia bacterium]